MGPTLTRGEMLDRLTQRYDLSELRRLCFELSVPYQELAGETLSDKAISLIEWMERRERLPELVARLQRLVAPPDLTPPPVSPPPESGALRMARRKLAILEQQVAGYTALSVPAHLQIELEEARAEVARLEGRPPASPTQEPDMHDAPRLTPSSESPPVERNTQHATHTPPDASRSPYHSLTLRLSPANAEGAYPAELSGPDLAPLPAGTLQLNLAELAAIADADAYGRRLGEALFGEQGALRDAYQRAQVIFTERKWKMQLRLRLEAEELELLRWERLQHRVATRWYPLATAADPLFSRFIPAGEWELPEPVAGRPVRLWVVIASPPDLGQRGLDPISPEERAALHALFDALPGVEVTYLESETDRPPAWDALRAALLKGCHFLHLVCHGEQKRTGTVLYLEDRPVWANEVLELFRGLTERPRLVFLAACESAARGRADAFLPLGPALVAEGRVPAVVAMADRVGLTTARDFAAAFYTSLLGHGLVDRAAQEARLRVREQMDWSVPVLFSRLPDNRLLVETTTNGRGAAAPRPDAPLRPNAPPPDPRPNADPLPPNPFTDRLAIRDPARFVGREALLRRLLQTLQGGSVALVGERKTGKSSLLYRLEERLRPEPGQTVVLWDFFRREPVDRLWAAVLGALGAAGDSWEALRQAARGRRLVLLLDELEEAPARGFDVELLRACRALVQAEPGVRFVTASRALPKAIFPAGAGSYPYDFLGPLQLGDLTEAEARRLLAHPWAPATPAFDAATVTELLALAGLHPYRLQRAAHHRYEALADPEYGWRAAYGLELEALA